MSPTFSIVIPTFNRRTELERSIASVLNQTFENWELIIVDDQSSDDTENYISKVIRENARIRYIKRPMTSIKGVSTCRNLGVTNSNGEYVAFLDSDDEWNSNRLERDYYFLKSQKTQALYSAVLLDNGTKRTVVKSRHLKEQETYEDLIFSGENFAQTSTLVVNREVLKEVRFDSTLHRHEDMDFFMKSSRCVQ